MKTSVLIARDVEQGKLHATEGDQPRRGAEYAATSKAPGARPQSPLKLTFSYHAPQRLNVQLQTYCWAHWTLIFL